MSTHLVEVIQIQEIKKHPNADRLEIIPVGNWQCVVQSGIWNVGDRAVYVQPDYMVPTSIPEFSFLSEKEIYRLKAVRLRGEVSYGVLVPVPEIVKDAPVGSNVMEALGIQRYVPEIKMQNGENMSLPQEEWPDLFSPKYDLESLNNFPDVIQPDEMVYVTEKIHGANAKYVFHDGQMYCGSRNNWVRNDGKNIYSRAITPELIFFCKENPNTIIFGEVFGPVQSLRYGRTEPEFAAFSILNGGSFVPDPIWEFQRYGIQHVPALVQRKMKDVDLKIAETDSRISKVPQMMEGIVITSLSGRTDPNIGYVQLKHISDRYWLKK